MKLSDPIKMPEVNARTLLLVLCVLLAGVDVWLVIKTSAAIFTAHSMSAQEAQARQLQLRAEEMQIAPMRGLDQKLADSTRQADEFYDTRLPANISAVAAELGKLAQDSGVTLSRTGYAYKDAGSGLTQVRMDSALLGDYQPLMKFINAMERDKLFFVIRGIGLSGQTGGIVNLRLTADTYMRQNVPQVPDQPDQAGVPADASATGAGNANTPSSQEGAPQQ